MWVNYSTAFRAVCASAYGGKKNDSAASLDSSQPSLSPCPSRVLTGPLMSR